MEVMLGLHGGLHRHCRSFYKDREEIGLGRVGGLICFVIYAFRRDGAFIGMGYMDS